MKKLLVKAKKQPKNAPYVVLKEVYIKPLCKTCKQNERRLGSAYCQPCSDAYKITISK